MVVCFASSIFHDLFWRLAYVLRENVESIIHAFEPHTPRQKSGDYLLQVSINLENKCHVSQVTPGSLLCRGVKPQGGTFHK